MGLFVLATAGVLKALEMPRKQFLDISPQDFTVKALLYYIVKSSKLYENEAKPTEVPIFHMSTYTHTKFGVVDFINMVRDHKQWIEMAFEKNFLAPGLTITECTSYYTLVVSKPKTD